MSINLDLVIEAEEDTVDMKAGLDSMQGVSDAVRCIGETILSEKVPKRKTHASDVRTLLKKSFKGSYGHTFSLEVYNSGLATRLRKIGRATLVELISYFINEALYRDSGDLSERAEEVLGRLGEKAEIVISQLRKSSLIKAHQISTQFDHDIKIRYRKSSTEILPIAKFDRDTAEVLQAKPSNETIELWIIVTRLNIHTGNGRLQIQGEDETVAFGFGTKYKEVSITTKKTLSRNLDHNNGLERAHWKHLRISASPIKLEDGTVVKYLVKAVHAD